MPRQTLTEKLRARVETLTRALEDRRAELTEFDTPSRQRNVAEAAARLEDARFDLAALVPDAEAPDVEAIVAAEKSAAAARQTEARVKREAVERLIAHVAAKGPLPALWERVRAHVDNAARYGTELDIRFEHDPLADAVHPVLPERAEDGPPRIVITVPYRAGWTDCGALAHGVVWARRVEDGVRISYTSFAENGPMDGADAIRQAVERALSLWIVMPHIGRWSGAERTLEAVQTVALLEVQPTHRITTRPGPPGETRVALVHLTDDGSAYTREEWELEEEENADWTCERGVWHWRGHATPDGPKGVTVEALSGR